MAKALFIILALFILPSRVYPAWAAGDVDAGKAVYEKRCAWCHGADGGGDGPAAAFLSPAPRDFTFGVYKWKSTPFDEPSPSDGDFLKMIQGVSHETASGWTGMSGTSMPGWSDVLSEADALNVAAYLRKLSMLGLPAKPPIDVSNAPSVSSVSNDTLTLGKKLFEDRCAECHGQNGKGNGVKKLKDDWGGRTWPRNLTKPWTFRAGSGVKDVYTRITVGIPGTQMPSFADPRSRKKLDENERWAVAAYVATLSGKNTPGGDMMIRAKMVVGALPDKPNDPAWDSAPQAGFFLAPQMLAKEKHFTPSLDSIAVRAIHNSSEIALLLEWDDATMSVPRDKKSMEIAGGEVFPDKVAVQWPVNLRDNENPFFGMGDEVNPVEIWHWQGPANVGVLQTIKLLEARGAGLIATQDASGLNAAGVYDDGTWRVVMRGALKPGDARRAEGQFLPMTFAAWDGSNNEKGSKHVMTGWQTLYLEPERGAFYSWAWAVAVGLVVLGAEILWVRGGKRKGKNE